MKTEISIFQELFILLIVGSMLVAACWCVQNWLLVGKEHSAAKPEIHEPMDTPDPASTPSEPEPEPEPEPESGTSEFPELELNIDEPSAEEMEKLRIDWAGLEIRVIR